MSSGLLTSRQRQILDYIKEEIRNRGYPPSVRDICDAVHLKSTSSVHAHLATLEREGYIRRDPAKPRTIEVVDEDFYMTRREMTSVPLVGQVAAGEPILAEQNIEEYFPLPSDCLPDRPVFMLKIRGDSMINAGILNGDIVVVAQQNTARNGDIVVALIEDSATVKRFFRENGYIRLQPENEALEPIIVRGDLKILGKVVGVLRFMK